MDKTKNKIIVADDDFDMRGVVIDSLRDSFDGFEFIQAPDGETVLKLLQENEGQVALVFTDNTMYPGMGGLELSKKISQLGLNIPVIMLAGVDADSAFTTQLKEASVTAFLLKPPDLNRLIETAKALIEK